MSTHGLVNTRNVKHSWKIVFVFIALKFVISSSSPPHFDHGIELDTIRPLVLAHRGLSGAYPEHTVMAYQKAIEEGADIIECDVCITKDLQLVCLHEAWLSRTTDVENRPEFADRKTIEIVNGAPINDWFTVDFTLAELKTIRVKQRFDFRDSTFDGMYSITTLEEYINLAKEAPRAVGIYPEAKDPAWVNSKEIIVNSGQKFEDFILQKLAELGYTKATDPCFVQSFDEESIKYMAPKTNLPLIQLLGSSANVSQAKLEDFATRAYGLGVSKRLIVNHYTPINGDKNWIITTTDLVTRAHALGLKVHAYTARNEDRYLAWDYMQDPWYEYEKFLSLEVDGMFTDFTPTMKKFLDWQYRNEEPMTTPVPSGVSIVVTSVFTISFAVFAGASI